MSNPLEGTNSSACIIVTETTIGNSNQQHNAGNRETKYYWKGLEHRPPVATYGNLPTKKDAFGYTHKKQPVIQFRPNSANPFMTPITWYSNEKMREALATAILMHGLYFNIVDA
ncbi:hypothetical protein Lal_00025288 [Lupinus albus]|nr:hypothetical protein Lal_00025288 [Lupinus albus]